MYDPVGRCGAHVFARKIVGIISPAVNKMGIILKDKI
jgi:hypothetical protein